MTISLVGEIFSGFATQADVSLFDMILPLFWLCAFLAEMSIYCFFGNNITYSVRIFFALSYSSSKMLPHQFGEIPMDAYFSDFIHFDELTSKALQMLMLLSSSRPIIIRAEGLMRFELSLATLLKVRTSSPSKSYSIRISRF